MVELEEKFEKIICAIISDQNRVLKGQTREEYLAARDLQIGDLTADELKTKAFHFYQSKRFEEALILFDSDNFDGKSGGWTHFFGRLYETEDSSFYDLDKAYWCYLASATPGFICQPGLHYSKVKVAEFYKKGLGVTQDDDKALYWLEQAIGNGEHVNRWSLLKSLIVSYDSFPLDFLLLSDQIFAAYCDSCLNFEIDSEYQALLDEVEAEQSRILEPYSGSKDQYFSALETKPEREQGRRFGLAVEFVKLRRPNYEAALICFDTSRDFIDENWVNFLGYCFNQAVDNPIFNTSISNRLYFKAAELGNTHANFNIAARYFNGVDGSKNFDAALHWYDKARQAGHIDAPAWMAEIYMENDPRYNNPDHPEFTKMVNELVCESAENGSVKGIKLAAGLLAQGKNEWKFDISVVYDFLYVNEPDFEEVPYHADGLLHYVQRQYLGLDMDCDLTKALEILNSIPVNTSSHRHVHHTVKEQVDSFRPVIEKEIQQKNDPSYGSAREFVQRAYLDTSVLEGAVIAVRNDKMLADEVFITFLEFTNHLARSEGWNDKHLWHNLLQEAQAKRLGYSLEQILSSTLTEGPKYNPIGSNGLPVLGVWENPSESEEVSEHHMINTGSFVPEAGVVAFKGLSAEQGGSIEFDFVMAADRPAMLTAEDFEVALLLSFGNPERVIQPSLSLEDPKDYNYDDPYNVFQYKLWSPHWLGYTDFGRTLYVTDHLIGSLCWRPREFQIGVASEALNPQMPEFANDLVEDIALTGGHFGQGGSKRVMLKPEHISIHSYVDRSGSVDKFQVAVNEVKMRVDGSYIVEQDEENGEENRLVGLNDTTFQQGRVVEKLTERYSDIASILPIFERARQMMGLIHSLKTLREMGFEPSEPILRRIRKKYNEFGKLPPLPREELLAMHLPVNEGLMSGEPR
ncbi:MAG: SEL1-like repeat protein [Rhizobiales bacterium]|nr:SEL1-like repeat protein [Hyphomicrobiales bacterium]